MNATFTEVACPTCENQISIPNVGRSQCPHCGQSIELEHSPILIDETPPPMRRDTNELFNEAGTHITRSQLMTRGMVISIANISGVSTRIVQAKRGWPAFSICLGLLFLFSMAWLMAAIFIVPAVILLAVRRNKYALDIHSGGTEFNLTFDRQDAAHRAAFALSQAMDNR